MGIIETASLSNRKRAALSYMAAAEEPIWDGQRCHYCGRKCIYKSPAGFGNWPSIDADRRCGVTLEQRIEAAAAQCTLFLPAIQDGAELDALQPTPEKEQTQ